MRIHDRAERALVVLDKQPGVYGDDHPLRIFIEQILVQSERHDDESSNGHRPVVNVREQYQEMVETQLRTMRGGAELDGGLTETPQRVTRMWLDELTSGYDVPLESLFR